jgi:P-type Cu2+ transporter
VSNRSASIAAIVVALMPSATHIIDSETTRVSNPDAMSVRTERSVDRAQLDFEVFDMDCAACAIQIEAFLSSLPGVLHARVHFATQRARVTYDRQQIDRGSIEQEVEALGYQVSGASPLTREQSARKTRKRFLWRVGIASFCAMQVMMFSVPRYLGGDEIEPALGRLMDAAAFAMTLPVFLFCVSSFFRGAMRELRIRRLGMDCAVAASMVTALLGSMWHLWVGSGDLYFDSIAMFAALLLAVRWWEWEQREGNRCMIETGTSTLSVPQTELIASTGIARGSVAADQIRVGDLLLVRSGESIAIDGELCSDAAECDESTLTGESRTVPKQRGDALFAGTINIGPAIEMRATATYSQSAAQRLLQLADESARPPHQTLPNAVAKHFLPTIAVTSLATFVAVLPLGVSIALERMIAILIVSCPCALALAAPAARAKAFAQLLRLGVVVRRSDSIERLARANAFLLDKTGTLTRPERFVVVGTRDDIDEGRAVSVLAALQHSMNHPLARAAPSHETKSAAASSYAFSYMASGRLIGIIDNTSFAFYRLFKKGKRLASGNSLSTNGNSWVLEDPHGWVATFRLEETLRLGAKTLIESLQSSGEVALLSGDADVRVKQLSRTLKIVESHGECSPEFKAKRVRALQAAGKTVAMIGDGVNDSVGFAGADVAIAVDAAIDRVRVAADIICTKEDLVVLAETVKYSKRVLSVMCQNLVWAITYNALALPLAALGYVNPLLAATGMAASSALVVLNVTRLRIASR